MSNPSVGNDFLNVSSSQSKEAARRKLMKREQSVSLLRLETAPPLLVSVDVTAASGNFLFCQADRGRQRPSTAWRLLSGLSQSVWTEKHPAGRCMAVIAEGGAALSYASWNHKAFNRTQSRVVQVELQTIRHDVGPGSKLDQASGFRNSFEVLKWRHHQCRFGLTSVLLVMFPPLFDWIQSPVTGFGCVSWTLAWWTSHSFSVRVGVFRIKINGCGFKLDHDRETLVVWTSHVVLEVCFPAAERLWKICSRGSTSKN